MVLPLEFAERFCNSDRTSTTVRIEEAIGNAYTEKRYARYLKKNLKEEFDNLK